MFVVDDSFCNKGLAVRPWNRRISETASHKWPRSVLRYNYHWYLASMFFWLLIAETPGVYDAAFVRMCLQF